jgi:hypothetical protein
MHQKANQKHTIMIRDNPEGMAAGDLLQLLIDQLEGAMRDNNAAVAGLIDDFGAIGPELGRMQSGDDAGQTRIQQQLERITEGFQQHDSFNQRLEHVLATLTTARTMLEDGQDKADPACWESLSAQLSASYTTAQERDIHSRVTGSEPPPLPGDDVELF